MKTLGPILALGLASCTHGGQGAQRTSSPPKGPFIGPLPDIEVQSLDGQTARLRELTKGKVAVIDMWATWCTSCRDVTARATELAKSESPEKLVVIGVDEGEEVKEVRAYLSGPGSAYPIYVDTAYDLANEIGSESVPTILIVGRDGKVRGVTHKLDAKAVHLVGELLAEEDSPPAPAPPASQ